MKSLLELVVRFAVIPVALGLASSAQAVITEDLVLHATHDSADVTATTSADGAPGFPHTGTVNGTLANPPGLIGDALEFDGNDANHVSYGDTLDPGKHSYTLALWFNADSTSGVQFVAGKGNASSGSAGFSIFIENGTLIARGFQNGQPTTERFSQSIASTISAATWHHVALVIDTENDIVRGYLDGSNAGWVTGGGGGQVDTLVDGATIDVGDALLLGRRSSAGVAFDGLIDDVAIFSRALSPAEVDELFDEGILGNDVQAFSTPEAVLRTHTTYDAADVSASGVDDTTGIAQNGVIEGTLTNPSGQIGDALGFDGMDANHVDHGDGLDPGPSSYTVALWFNADDVNAASQYLASKGNAGSNDNGWSIFMETGTLIVRAKQLTATSGQRAGQNIGASISSATWHHVALVVDTENDVIRGYLDGSNTGWVAGGGGAPSDVLIDGDSIGAPQSLLVGRRSTAGAPFSGVADDVAIWTRALSAAEVQKLYDNGLAGFDASKPLATEVPSASVWLLALLGLGLATAGIRTLGRRSEA